jgi:hypothetical protein
MTVADPGDPLNQVLEALKRLRAGWPQRGWSWDSRLACVSSSFNTDIEPRAKEAAAVVLASEWTMNSIDQAPPALRTIAQRTGGLRQGQRVLSSTAFGRVFAYGLWWPWGDGMTTSMRIGLGGADSIRDASARLCDAFGVEP